MVACLAYLAGGRIGVGTAERDRQFSPADDARWQSTLAAGDVPYGHAPTVSTLAAHGSMDIARGRRTALRDFAAVTAAAAVALFGVWLRRAGVALYPAALAMFGLAAGSTFWWRGVSWNGDALSPALALVALWGVWHWRSSRGAAGAAIAVIAGGAAVLEDRAWLTLLPGVAIVLWSRAGSPVQRVGTLAALAAVAATGLTLAPGPALISLTFSPGELVGALAREFTPLGAFLVFAGFGVMMGWKSARPAAAVTAASLLWWQAVAASPPIELVSVPLAIAGWAAVAVALTAILETMPTRAGLAFATTIALMMLASPALTRERLSALGRDLPSTLAARTAADIDPAVLGAGTAFVAESSRVDAAILLSSRQAHTDVALVPQSDDEVLRAWRQGRTIYAFAGARTHLERRGFVFERAIVGHAVVGVMAGHLPCVDVTPGAWQDVSLLVARGSLVVHAAAPAVAPGGIVMRATSREPVQLRSIEPRSIPIEIAETAVDGAGAIELRHAAAPADIDRLTTIHVAETGRTDPVVVTFDSPPFATVASAEGAASRLCGGPVQRSPTLGRAESASAALRMNDYAPFGPGWHPMEADPDFFRWTGAPEASVRVTVGRPGPVRVTVTGTPAARLAQHPAIGLTVNDCVLATQPMTDGQGDYEWLAGEHCWRSGVNQMWIRVTPLISPASLFATHDTRRLGARIGAIRLARTPAIGQGATTPLQ